MKECLEQVVTTKTQHTEPQHRKPGLSEEKNIRMVTNRVFRVAR